MIYIVIAVAVFCIGCIVLRVVQINDKNLFDLPEAASVASLDALLWPFMLILGIFIGIVLGLNQIAQVIKKKVHINLHIEAR